MRVRWGITTVLTMANPVGAVTARDRTDTITVNRPKTVTDAGRTTGATSRSVRADPRLRLPTNAAVLRSATRALTRLLRLRIVRAVRSAVVRLAVRAVAADLYRAEAARTVAELLEAGADKRK